MVACDPPRSYTNRRQVLIFLSLSSVASDLINQAFDTNFFFFLRELSRLTNFSRFGDRRSSARTERAITFKTFGCMQLMITIAATWSADSENWHACLYGATIPTLTTIIVVTWSLFTRQSLPDEEVVDERSLSEADSALFTHNELITFQWLFAYIRSLSHDCVYVRLWSGSRPFPL